MSKDSKYCENINVKHIFHSGISKKTLRIWQSGSAIQHKKEDFVLPIFLVIEKDAKEPINSLHDIYRYGLNEMLKYVGPLVDLGLKSVLLFPVMSKKGIKYAFLEDTNPILSAIKALKKLFPELILIADVCLCTFLYDGHCCHFLENGEIDNEQSVKDLVEISLLYAKTGIDVIAPSDMMDSRIKFIKKCLFQNKLDHVSVMSYSTKFSSCLYGPFREAANSAPALNTNRKSYQLPIGGKGLALKTAERDIEEGADFLMVKPGIFYLDIIKSITDKHPNTPIAVYQVSGEYSMLHAGSQCGAFDLETCLFESITAFKRAGASIIITYFTPFILKLFNQNIFQYN